LELGSYLGLDRHQEEQRPDGNVVAPLRPLNQTLVQMPLDIVG
jgi:hypothetical protein